MLILNISDHLTTIMSSRIPDCLRTLEHRVQVLEGYSGFFFTIKTFTLMSEGRMAEQSSVGRKRVLGDGVGGCGRM